MATPKPTDLEAYRHMFPYSSQMFGVYQPLLGLRSRSGKERVNQAAQAAVKHVITALTCDTRVQASHAASPRPIGPGEHVASGLPAWLGVEAAGHAHQAITALRQHAGREPSTAELVNIVHAASAHAAGGHAAGGHAAHGHAAHGHGQAAHGGAFGGGHATAPKQAVHEAIVAGTMEYLAKHAPAVLRGLFHGSPTSSPATALTPYLDPLAHFSPTVQAAVVSPIGLVQLYRQYFFELDAFLGPPVGHVWVSPGGSLEVYEVHSSKATQTRETSQSTDSTQSSDKTSQQQDDLSSAVSQDSSQNMAVGVTAQAGMSVGVYHASVSSSLNMGNTQKSSQQTASKQTRGQSEKVSNQIRSSFKTSFKTTLEQKDLQSRRYVLANTTDHLVNYELRRKMRKVGVQVQYVSTKMCWQVFVDQPGDTLGISNLVHLDQPADLSSVQSPQAPPPLAPQQQSYQATFNFEGIEGHNHTSDDYTDGTSHDFFSGQHDIVATRSFEVPPPAAGYHLKQVTMTSFTPSDPSRKNAYASPKFTVHATKFDLHLAQANFDDSPSLIFSLSLTWAPDPELAHQQAQAYAKQMADFKWHEAQAVHAAYVNAVRDRIKVMGQVAKRDSDDLRDEERSVIYQSILSKIVPAPHDPASNFNLAHVTSEMLRSIFDIDNMLYYVAPDWWNPQPARGKPPAPHPQAAGHHPAAKPHGFVDVPPGVEPEPLTPQDLVAWNNKGHGRASNYQVTEESAPAPLGASLGWLLQLDGDDRRNAFLNAPWVKAVLPILPGKEEEALQWLIKDHVEGTDGLDDKYSGQEPDLQGKTIGEAIRYLAKGLSDANTSAENTPESQTVYEDGFDPLAKGFRATGTAGEVFDQWIEVLPTDQVVALEYTPPALPT